VIDKATRSIIQTINLPAGKFPGKPVVSLDDRLLYVPNQGVFVAPGGYQGASVLIIDTQSRSLIGEIPLNPSNISLNRLVITPDESLIYTVKTKSLPMRAFVIDTALREVVATITANISPTDVLMNHTGTRFYVLTTDSVVVFDTATNTEVRRQLIRPNGRLNSMALSLDGGSLFVNDEFAASLLRLDSKRCESSKRSREA